MSYDISTKRLNASSRHEWFEAEDRARGAFLKQLDEAENIEVTQWEAAFIETFLSAALPSAWWTEGRRISCDEMRKRYEGKL